MARQSYPLADNNPPAKRFSPYVSRETTATLIRYMWEYLLRLGDYCREIVEVANGARDGKLNAVADVTWSNAATTTVISDTRIGPDSHIDFVPLTANANAIFIAGWHISSRDKGTCTVTHTSIAQADHDFTMLIIG